METGRVEQKKQLNSKEREEEVVTYRSIRHCKSCRLCSVRACSGAFLIWLCIFNHFKTLYVVYTVRFFFPR